MYIPLCGDGSAALASWPQRAGRAQGALAAASGVSEHGLLAELPDDLDPDLKRLVLMRVQGTSSGQSWAPNKVILVGRLFGARYNDICVFCFVHVLITHPR
eukprot:1236250-Heterocapsa_arctica.AAC.1